MTSKDKINWFFILVVLWVSGALFITLHEYFFLANYPSVTEVEQMTSYSFKGSLIAAVVWGLMAGSIFSALELFYFSAEGKAKEVLRRAFTEILPYGLTSGYDFEKNSSQEID